MALPSIWVAILRISPATAQKLAIKHRLTADEVRDTVQCIEGLRHAPAIDDQGRNNVIGSAALCVWPAPRTPSSTDW